MSCTCTSQADPIAAGAASLVVGSVEIPNGATSIAVPLTLTSDSYEVLVGVESPLAATVLYANVAGNSKGSNGFTANLSGPTPTDGFRLVFQIAFMLMLLFVLPVRGQSWNTPDPQSAFPTNLAAFSGLVLAGTAQGTYQGKPYSFLNLRNVTASNFVGNGFYLTNLNVTNLAGQFANLNQFTNLFPTGTNGSMLVSTGAGWRAIPGTTNTFYVLKGQTSGIPYWGALPWYAVAGLMTNNFQFQPAPSSNYVWGTVGTNLTGQWVALTNAGGGVSSGAFTNAVVTNVLLLAASVNENNDNWSIPTDVWNTASNEGITGEADDLRWYPKTNGLFLIQWKSLDVSTNKVAYVYLTTNYSVLDLTNYYDYESSQRENMNRRWAPVYVDTNSAVWIRREFSSSPYVGAQVKIWLILR